jgi:hypothetical protein
MSWKNSAALALDQLSNMDMEMGTATGTDMSITIILGVEGNH